MDPTCKGELECRNQTSILCRSTVTSHVLFATWWCDVVSGSLLCKLELRQITGTPSDYLVIIRGILVHLTYLYIDL